MDTSPDFFIWVVGAAVHVQPEKSVQIANYFNTRDNPGCAYVHDASTDLADARLFWSPTFPLALDMTMVQFSTILFMSGGMDNTDGIRGAPGVSHCMSLTAWRWRPCETRRGRPIVETA